MGKQDIWTVHAPDFTIKAIFVYVTKACDGRSKSSTCLHVSTKSFYIHLKFCLQQDDDGGDDDDIYVLNTTSLAF